MVRASPSLNPRCLIQAPAADITLPIGVASQSDYGAVKLKPNRLIAEACTDRGALSKIGADEDIRVVTTHGDVG